MSSKFDPQKHHRHSIRLPNYDYSQPGAYYVTIVAWHRECLFGDVVNEEMRLNKVGQIVHWEWEELPKRLPYVELGAFVVMPNHFHGILILHEHVEATRQSQPQSIEEKVSVPNWRGSDHDGSPLPQKPTSLGTLIAQFKSRATKRLWKIPSLNRKPIWQRSYYEHIIRSDKDLQNKTDYIEANPALWNKDDENHLNIKP